MAVGDSFYGRWRSSVWPLEIVGMDVGYRLHGSWISVVWPLEIVCMVTT